MRAEEYLYKNRLKTSNRAVALHCCSYLRSCMNLHLLNHTDGESHAETTCFNSCATPGNLFLEFKQYICRQISHVQPALLGFL